MDALCTSHGITHPRRCCGAALVGSTLGRRTLARPLKACWRAPGVQAAHIGSQSIPPRACSRCNRHHAVRGVWPAWATWLRATAAVARSRGRLMTAAANRTCVHTHGLRIGTNTGRGHGCTVHGLCGPVADQGFRVSHPWLPRLGAQVGRFYQQVRAYTHESGLGREKPPARGKPVSTRHEGDR